MAKKKKKQTVKMIPVLASETSETAVFEPTPVDDIIVAIKPETKKAVTLRLEPSLIERLKEHAARHNMGYQTLARELLKHALAESSPRKAGGPAAKSKR